MKQNYIIIVWIKIQRKHRKIQNKDLLWVASYIYISSVYEDVAFFLPWLAWEVLILTYTSYYVSCRMEYGKTGRVRYRLRRWHLKLVISVKDFFLFISICLWSFSEVLFTKVLSHQFLSYLHSNNIYGFTMRC